MELTTVTLNGTSLRLRSWGQPTNRPTILLLHAAGESSLSWEQQAEHWAKTGSVHALDFRGHGGSDRTPHYSLELMTEDVLALLGYLALDEVWIVGHSLGGIVGYLIASARRREVTKLVLEEAPPPLPIVPPRAVPAEPGGDVGFDWQAITDLYAQRNSPDPVWWQQLDQIEVPVLILAGGDSSHVDQDQMYAMSQRIQGSTMITIESGHQIHAHAPHKFLSSADSFLGIGPQTSS